MESAAGRIGGEVEPSLFARKATGLVRGWAVRDAFIYAFFSINLVTLGFFIFSYAVFIPDGSLMWAVLLSGAYLLMQAVTYASLVAAMPRAGGDYVWISRTLGGGLGHHRGPGVALHLARDQDLRQDPAVLLLRRTARAGVHVRPLARQLEDGLHLRAQYAVGGRARDWRQPSPGDDRGRRRRHGEQRGRLRPAQRRLPTRPVHRLLQPVVELGRHALRRGPRGVGLPQEHRGHGRGPDGDYDPGRHLAALVRKDVRLGLLQRGQQQLLGPGGALQLRRRRPVHFLPLSRATRRLPDGRRVLAVPPCGPALAVVLRLGGDRVPVVNPGGLRDRLRPGASRGRCEGGSERRPLCGARA